MNCKRQSEIMRLLLCSLFIFFFSSKGYPQLLINEIMQSNIDCIMDDLNEFPDSWVELYNNSSADVNLGDFRLGVSVNAADSWQLPDSIIGSGMHVLIYCDKESQNLHTPFRLESGKGGEVYLFKEGIIIDRLTDLKKQPAPNIAYGRISDGADQWGYELSPTPGTSNNGKVCERNHILGNPLFSVEGQVLNEGESFQLILSQPEDAPEGTRIFYTTDGSEPTVTSEIYKEPIQISETMVIRAKMLCEGWLSPISIVNSYIFFPRELTLPLISISTDSRYLYDPKIGIYVSGSWQEGVDNFSFNWRRPINIEYFEGFHNKSILNQLCETRIAGSGTRPRYELKSMAIYANKRFGEKRFNYEFFPEDKPGVSDFKSLVLRNSGTDFDNLYMRDAIVQRVIARNVDVDWQAYSPAIFYINGVYKGIINIRERGNE